MKLLSFALSIPVFLFLSFSASADSPPEERSCYEMDMVSCLRLVREYNDSRFDNLPRSFNLFTSACEKGDAFACAMVGHFVKIRVLPKDMKAGKLVDDGMLARLEAGCRSGDKYACLGGAMVHHEGMLEKRDPEKAFAKAKAACDLGLPKGCTMLGDLHARGLGTAKDHGKAMKLFSSYCQEKEKEGCFLKGFALLGAYGGPEAPEEAFASFTEACRAGDAHGCSSLGWCYQNGKGTSESMKLAMDFHQLGCDKGHYDGCMNLGRIYLSDEYFSVPKAFNNFERACEMGRAGACYELALLSMDKSEETAKLTPRALRYVEQTCELEDEAACQEASIAYEQGQGTSRSPAKAKVFRDKADALKQLPERPIVVGK